MRRFVLPLIVVSALSIWGGLTIKNSHLAPVKKHKLPISTITNSNPINTHLVTHSNPIQRFESQRYLVQKEMQALGLNPSTVIASYPSSISYSYNGNTVQYLFDQDAKLVGFNWGDLEVQYHVPDRPHLGYRLRMPSQGITSFQEVFETQTDVAGNLVSVTHVPTTQTHYFNTPSQADFLSLTQLVKYSTRNDQIQEEEDSDQILKPYWGNLGGTPNPFRTLSDCLEYSKEMQEATLRDANDELYECHEAARSDLLGCAVANGVQAGLAGAALGAGIGSVAGGVGAVPGMFIGGMGAFSLNGLVCTALYFEDIKNCNNQYNRNVANANEDQFRRDLQCNSMFQGE